MMKFIFVNGEIQLESDNILIIVLIGKYPR